jgi:exo-1,4-beta-D-glucosaminidase
LIKFIAHATHEPRKVATPAALASSFLFDKRCILPHAECVLKYCAALIVAFLASGLLGVSSADAASPPSKVLLTNDWAIQSSAKFSATGDAISTPGFPATGWFRANVPSTVVGTLVDDGVFPDPFFGTNFRTVPGMDYPIGVIFSQREMSNNSPYRVPWWYRKEFAMASPPGRQVWLNFDGINCRANLWLNGKQFANTNDVVGAYRTYRFNVTDLVKPNKNALAAEIFAPVPTDLAINWVDWNPTPADKNMGLWRDVYLTTSGPVALHDPQVSTKVNAPALDAAQLTVSAKVENTANAPVETEIAGTIEKIKFRKTVVLGPHETRHVSFDSTAFPQLTIRHPALWWPVHLGPQTLHHLNLQATVAGELSDSQTVRFGMREVTSDLGSEGYRIFKINGKPVLIRGGGWAPDVFLRPSPTREIQEINYVKNMNLNAIRFEGKTENDRFLDLCDEEGILVIAGWCCCDYWERWARWKDNDYSISGASLSNQVCRIRNHPSILTFWYGSDMHPNFRAETNYLKILQQLHWPNPAQSSASASQSEAGSPTGIRMTGPYNYIPPMYWYADTHAGGAYSFNTETSCGPAIPPIESLRRMLPADHLWPVDDVWSYHAGGGPFKSLAIYNEALAKRLGPPKDVIDYAEKSQVMAYDGVRAMFEAYGRNKYHSTGVIQWMMNNAWPSLIWHLYDYYLRPGGGYFGAKTACEPVHIQYSYDDRSIAVVNSYERSYQGLVAEAQVLNMDMTVAYSHTKRLDLPPDGSVRAMVLPELPGLSPVYFVKLILRDARGRLLSRNFYWLSTQPDTLGQPREGSSWYYTPTKQFADLTALNQLPPVHLQIKAHSSTHGGDVITTVTVQNPSKSLAFFVHLKVNHNNEEILPVLWQDNYFELTPGEKRTVTATYRAPGGGPRTVEVNGWNVAPETCPAR